MGGKPAAYTAQNGMTGFCVAGRSMLALAFLADSSVERKKGETKKKRKGRRRRRRKERRKKKKKGRRRKEQE